MGDRTTTPIGRERSRRNRNRLDFELADWSWHARPGAVRGGQHLAQGRASASQPSCGGIVTADTKLNRDLLDCSGDGIVIGADNITLDLHRHTVDGASTAGAEGPDVGIRNDGHDGVTIKGGTVQELDFGLFFFNGLSENSPRVSSRPGIAGPASGCRVPTIGIELAASNSWHLRTPAEYGYAP